MPEDPQRARPLMLAEHLDRLAAALAVPPPSTAALASARRAFAIAGVVCLVLEKHTMIARDAHTSADLACTHACRTLDEILDPSLLQAESHATHVEIDDVWIHGHQELENNSNKDLERISAALIALATRLEELLASAAINPALPPELSAAARLTRDDAHELRVHFSDHTA